MKKYLTIIAFLHSIFSISQPDTEVFLFDLSQENGTFQLSNFRNISNNEGYDNQPSFLDNHTMLYAGTRNGQTDIVEFNISTGEKQWICETEGGEYSPLKIPNQNAVSAIRLDKDGTQVLRKYDLNNGQSEVLVDDIIIGYQVWNNDTILLSSVLEDDGLSLYVTNPNVKKYRKIEANIGRSLHNIPISNLVSFISKEKDSIWEIKSVDPKSGETKYITNTLPKTEDMCWLSSNTILMGKGDKLYKLQLNKGEDWVEVASLSGYGISNITRLAVSPGGTKLAVVGEVSNQKLAPKLENIKWISGNWKGEAFGGQIEEHWSEPSGGSMMATFKLINDGKVSFYEIEIIREVENSLILQLKHFNSDLKGWETKDETIDFPLIEVTTNKVVFEGMTFEKVSDHEMNVYVDIHQKDGTIETVKFIYRLLN
ncbi:MAG TPA: DUF6265 family protein [Flavobacteriaceae bacterium]